MYFGCIRRCEKYRISHYSLACRFVEMVLTYVKSQKGANMLVYNGYIHRKEKTIDQKTIWKCAQYNKHKCTGRVHTVGDEVVKSTSHNHVADASILEAKKACNRMKELAHQVDLTTQGIIATVSQEVSVGATGQLPSISSLKRTLQNTRQRVEAIPANPRSLTELIIPEEYTRNNNGEPFLLFDSGPNEQRILIFSTERNLTLMASCEHWYADGTFTCTPLLFGQLYTIHGVQYSNVIPTVFALLPNKTQATYTRLFHELKTLRPGLRPTTIMVDYEIAAINALQQEFPEVRIRGCFFHFTQCLWRNMQCTGLQQVYTEDANFALHLRQLAALAFVPEVDVVATFGELLDSEFYTQNGNLLTPLINYFEDVWIGRLDRRQQIRPPMFPRNLWNCFEFIEEDLPRTNNAVEGWHNSFSSILNAAHPNLWKFITGLKKEESLNRLKVEQYIAGNQQPQKKFIKIQRGE
uniref:Uncharacterized protein LOC114343419 n=1 Tax=Diabrotica virgifera virgifera TaxID=50390 RepID=A0A6P7GX96_DIAVI